MNANSGEYVEFKKIVLDFYKAHKRNFPWRETFDPYKILVSEIMLQQTQIPRVLPKYENWFERFPTIEDLAHAEQSEVLRLWSGLGYNRRALSLHKLSKIVVEKHEGKIPMEIHELKNLPGIGEYTSKAVYTFSTNKPSVFIETNIRSVFLFYFYNNQEKVSDSQIRVHVENTLNTENPREWYYALMDYGTWLKKEYGNPNKKSTSYAKQSKFAGSKRQIRGRILKELHIKEHLSIEEITDFSKREKSEVELIVNELSNEGFIVVEGEKITLR